MHDQMTEGPKNRLTQRQIKDNFSELHPSLSSTELRVAAERCYFCFDAPCSTACPTDIDIPAFIQKLGSGNIRGSAQTILSENIMGGMCARVCPTEQLCEQQCVRNTGEDKPVAIGRLQRCATDLAIEQNIQFFKRGADSGKRIAIIGAGPASLACAHRLSMLGHHSTIYEARAKAAGLNEHGIAAYKAMDDIAARELHYILEIGGIDIKTGLSLGKDIQLCDLHTQYDAVFIGFGLAGVNALGINNENLSGVEDAVAYIEQLRQLEDKTQLGIGEKVLVIGGGMTAIDIAIQSKLLGADEVTIVYRRGQGAMPASEYEQNLAQTHNISIKYWASPYRLSYQNGQLTGMEFEQMKQDSSGLSGTGNYFKLDADHIFKAIGQTLQAESLGLTHSIQIDRGRIVVNKARQTSLAGVWAGGDCVLGGDNLTVSAVQDGKLAAISIDQSFQ